MPSNADLSVAVFTTPGLDPDEVGLLRYEAALLDRVWRALRDAGIDAACIELDAEESTISLASTVPPLHSPLDDLTSSARRAARAGRGSRLSVAR